MRDTIFIVFILAILGVQFIIFGFTSSDPVFSSGSVADSFNLSPQSAENLTGTLPSDSTDTSIFSFIGAINALVGFGLIEDSNMPASIQVFISFINWLMALMLILLLYRQIRSGAG